MIKLPFVILSSALVAAGLCASAAAEARPYYAPYHHFHDRYWGHDFHRDRWDRFHRERWERR
jgi:hypothetical protein